MAFGADSTALPDRTRRMVGSVDQLVSVERLIRDEGPGRGTPVLVVRNPRGVSFEVLLDRAMDIGWADAPQLSLAWRSARGPVESSRYEPAGSGWTRTFGGGLLSTCGLASTGMASIAGGTHYGLHGRIGHIPAENVRWQLVDDGDDLSVEITGDVLEAALGTAPLRLRRRILASTMRPSLRVEDIVSNEGYIRAGHMFRHHLNVGYPLVQPGTVVTASADAVGERDRPGGEPRALPWTLDMAPVSTDAGGVRGGAAEAEIVLYCRPRPGPTATVRVTAPDRAWLEVEQSTDTFPLLVLWRDPTPGVNVLGIEPSTSRDGGRAQAERDGEVTWLAPGEHRVYSTVVRAGR